MKYRKILSAAVAVAAALCCLTGCSGDFIDELISTEEAGNAFTAEAIGEDSPESGSAAGTVEISAENVGTGLEQLVITGSLDEDPNREIVRRRTPVRQIRGIDVNGNTLSDEFYFYRSTLSGTNKQAYDQIYAALYNGVQSVNLSVSVSTSDICDVVYSVYYDHPELFWVDSSLSYSYNYSNVVTSVTVNFNGTANDLSGSQQRFESAIAPLLSTARTLSNDIDKVKLVHDYLTNTIDYTSGSQYNQSAYSAIVNGKTVCAGYAHAFQYCMQKLGIPAAYIVGYAGEAHAWNILKLDGEYYCMDVTWDDPLNNPANYYYYNYFNITDAQISKDHTRDAISARLPQCSGTKYSFDSYFGGSAYGSDLSNLFTSDLPSEYGHTDLPAATTPAVTTRPSVTTQPPATYPDVTTAPYTDDYTYIDDWSDEDWDNYWNDLDGWLYENGYDDIDYDNFDDWNNYYYGDDWNDYYDYDYDNDYDYDYDYDYDSDDYYNDYYNDYYYEDYWYDEYNWLYGY